MGCGMVMPVDCGTKTAILFFPDRHRDERTLRSGLAWCMKASCQSETADLDYRLHQEPGPSYFTIIAEDTVGRDNTSRETAKWGLAVGGDEVVGKPSDELVEGALARLSPVQVVLDRSEDGIDNGGEGRG